MIGFEENDISINAYGGTELVKRKLASIVDPKLLEQTQIICSRVRDLAPDKIRILWLHDLPNDPESIKLKDEEYRNQFHKFIFVSNWQMQQYINFLGMEPSDKFIVMESGFDPIDVDWDAKKSETIRFCYTSTPQRGLNILLPVFEQLAERFENVHLDVFSSFKIYGWDDYDKQFEALYDVARNHPKMTYHGFVPNDELHDYLKAAHVHAYPSIWQETSCRAMLEAMSAGLLCVHPNLGALPETSGGLNFMYQFDTDINKHAGVFYRELVEAYDRVQNNQDELNGYLRFIKSYVDGRYNLDKNKWRWENMISELVQMYPDSESRNLPEKMFRLSV